MRLMKHVLIASLAGVCMLLATSTLAQDPSARSDEAAWMQQYNASLFDAVLGEGTPRSMVLAANSLITFGQDTKANQQRKYDLLKQAAQMAPNDAWVQWFAALHADPAENVSEPALVLQRLEPDNGAIWLFQLNAATRVKDIAGITDALARIGASRTFDDHFVAFTVEWLKFFQAHPESMGIIDEAIDEGEVTASERPLVMAIARAAAMTIPSFAGTFSACRLGKQPLSTERRAACLSAGRLIANESKTFLSQGMGIGMLSMVGAEDASELKRNKDYLTWISIGVFNDAIKDPQEFARYQADFVQTGSEIQAVKNALTRAGIPLLPPADWKPEPYPWTETKSKAHAD